MHCSGMLACPSFASNSPCAKPYWDSRNTSSFDVSHWRGEPKTTEVSFRLASHLLGTCQLQLRPLGQSPL